MHVCRFKKRLKVNRRITNRYKLRFELQRLMIKIRESFNADFTERIRGQFNLSNDIDD